jgi:hypothetical protein
MMIEVFRGLRHNQFVSNAFQETSTLPHLYCKVQSHYLTYTPQHSYFTSLVLQGTVTLPQIHTKAQLLWLKCIPRYNHFALYMFRGTHLPKAKTRQCQRNTYLRNQEILQSRKQERQTLTYFPYFLVAHKTYK